MKYDKKWRGGVSVKVETDTESEPVITEENSVASPVKIAEELEKKTFTQQRRRRQSSSGSAKMTGLTPSPRARSGKSESRLKVSVAGRRASVSPPGTGHTPIPTATLSEMSEAFLSPRSPLFDIANVMDISEVLEEEDVKDTSINKSKSQIDEEEESSEDDRSRRLSDLIIDSTDLQKNVEANQEAVKNMKLEKERDGNVTKKKTERNPFHFNSSRLKSSTEKSDSEPKKQNSKVSNKKRNEIMDSHPPSVHEEVKSENEDVAVEDSESETIKEIHEKKSRKKWNIDSAQNSQPIFNFPKPPLPQESSFESSCYYCRHVCKRHQSLIANESVLNVSPRTTKRHEEKVLRRDHPPSPTDHGVDVGIQVGKPTVHHYLFDPTQDALFEDKFSRPEYPRSLHISESKVDLATSAVIDLMRRQLELTEHQMQSQKTLYRSFCKSLEKTQSRRAQQDDADKILIGKSRRPEKLTFDEALRQVKEEMKLERKQLRDEKRKIKSGSKSSINKSEVLRHKHGVHDRSIEEMLPSASGVEENYETDFEEDTEIRTETFQSSS